jgi:hypothetical protein
MVAQQSRNIKELISHLDKRRPLVLFMVSLGSICALLPFQFSAIASRFAAFGHHRVERTLSGPGLVSEPSGAPRLRVLASEPIGPDSTPGGAELRAGTLDATSVQFNAPSFAVNEGDGKVTLTVTRTGATSGAVSVRYSTADGTANQKSDYIEAVGTLQMAAGETSKSFDVLIVDDAYVEGNESFSVTLSDPVGATIGTPNQATVTIIDNDSVPSNLNPIDQARFLVQLHYYDFLNRYPDSSGWDFWTNNINNCSPQPACVDVQRVNTSASFFLSIEFQNTGYLVERMYKAAYGDGSGTSTFNGTHQLAVPVMRFTEFLSDTEAIGSGVVVLQPGWEQLLESNKQAFSSEFVQRPRFINAFPTTMSPAQFVDQLNTNAGNVLSSSERATAVGLFAGAADTINTTARAQALRQVAENQGLYNADFNRAFVLMQYFGYLRRNPNDSPDSDYTGYDFWLTKLNQFGGNYLNAEMVKAFITSSEYRTRFAPASSAPSPTPTPGARPGTVIIDKPWVFLNSKGQSAQLTATLLDTQGSPAAGTVTWTSSAADKVSVDASGKLVANAIGSAQIVAQSAGVQSAPTLVTVAEPKAGALLVTDAQVVSVSSPLNLAPGDAPGVGTQYEVTLQGVTAPALGTVMLAAETAPIAGNVVATRQDSSNLIVTLALAPLAELFNDYDVNYNIDLSAFPLEAALDQSASQTTGVVWTNQWDQRSPGQTGAVRPLDAGVFSPFDCDGNIKPQLVSANMQLSQSFNLSLVIDDQPGYSKQALTGSATLTAAGSVKLNAGFKATGSCQAQARFKLPILGWASVIVMPAVRLGLGAELSGEILVVQGELGVEGTVGQSQTVGWECGGVAPGCRALSDLQPMNNLKTKSKIPSANDMEAKISGQFYIFAALDASAALGLVNAEILKAKIGPKQSFDLASEKDQAARTDYASTYDLKLEGKVEPGSGLKKAIQLAIDDPNADLSFGAGFSAPISESPKGSLSLDKTKIKPEDKVQFTVSLDQKTLDYFLLGCNVTGVELWRKREDESEFTQWKAMTQNVSAPCPYSYTYTWTPTNSDVGNYQIAAFVNTQLPVPWLEVMPNSIQNLEVTCPFSGGTRLGTLASTCTDTWVGTETFATVDDPGGTVFFDLTSNITWTYDPVQSNQTNNLVAFYTPSGTFDITSWKPSSGCTGDVSPKHFTIDSSTDPTAQNYGYLSIYDSPSLPPESMVYKMNGSMWVNVTFTQTCPPPTGTVSSTYFLPVRYADGQSPFTPGQTRLTGSSADNFYSFNWDFTRP